MVVAWSGGKDCTLALHEILQTGDYEIAALLTTITQGYERVNIHGVRRELIQGQAEALGFPLDEVVLSKNASNYEYEKKFEAKLGEYLSEGVNYVLFGDIFLEDVREYRLAMLERVGMQGVFPLWGKPSEQLVENFISLGFKARIAVVDSQVLGESFAGRSYDFGLLNDLPEGVDPCGENGEFHTFVYDGPLFKNPVVHEVGGVVLRNERFYFCDLLSN
ncbi:MAG: diphthine--ammonia ligase [Chloroflexi bacterium]|nr:diphthine--ammonia ligase [Chloroflexota bacterium]